MRRTTMTAAALLTALLAAGVSGCAKSYDEQVKDCAAALADRAAVDGDAPTVSEAKTRIDALDKTLADLVRRGATGTAMAKEKYDAVEAKSKGLGKGRPGACGPVSKGDYNALRMALAIDALGWTDEDGGFDKLKMIQGAGG